MKSDETIEGRERVGASTLRDRHALAPPHPRKMHTYACARRACSQTVQPQSENADDDSQKEGNLQAESTCERTTKALSLPQRERTCASGRRMQRRACMALAGRSNLKMKPNKKN